MKQRSAKKEREMRQRRALMPRFTNCEVGPVFLFGSMNDLYSLDDCRVMHSIAMSCTKRSQGMHERRKRSAQGSLTDPANLVPSCNACNMAIEDHPRIAHDLELVVRPGDDEWEALAAAPSKIVPFTAPRAVP